MGGETAIWEAGDKVITQDPPRLAVFTFGIFRTPADDPANQGFHDRNDKVMRIAGLSDGFIAHSGYNGEPGPASWGVYTLPRFYVERGDGWTPATLSLWRDLESLASFAYTGAHAEAMSHAHKWFQQGRSPTHAAWWVAADRTPDWADAAARHEHLHDHGPSAHAFDLAHPFASDGTATKIDRAVVETKALRNVAAAAGV